MSSTTTRWREPDPSIQQKGADASNTKQAVRPRGHHAARGGGPARRAGQRRRSGGGPSTDKHNVPLAQGTSAQSLFAAPGEHQVASTTSVKPCEWPLGQDPADYVDLVGTVIDAQRSGTFPYGTRSPVGVNLYYPEGAAAGEQFPALVWSPGTITDPGMYDASAWLLASDPDFTGAEHNSQAAALN